MGERDSDVRRAMWRATLAAGVPTRAMLRALAAGSMAGLSDDVVRTWDRALGDVVLSERLAAEAERLSAIGGRIVTPVDDDWPAGCPPEGVLRVRGALPGPGAVAIVGSRRADAYGRDVAGRIAASAAAEGRCVVSGGAMGVDAAAHRGAIDLGGRTVVVLGGGLDHPGPAANRGVFERALETGGGWVTPFPCDQRPARWSFLRRNRWIAGLAEAVVVVQAGVRSGARSTASAALKLGRPVWAVPGPMDAPLHQGCHALVKKGAQVMMSASDWLGGGTAIPMAAPSTPPEAARALWDALSVEPESLGVVGARAGIPGDRAARMATELELGGWLVRTGDGRLRRRGA